MENNSMEIVVNADKDSLIGHASDNDNNDSNTLQQSNEMSVTTLAEVVTKEATSTGTKMTKTTSIQPLDATIPTTTETTTVIAKSDTVTTDAIAYRNTVQISSSQTLIIPLKQPEEDKQQPWHKELRNSDNKNRTIDTNATATTTNTSNIRNLIIDSRIDNTSTVEGNCTDVLMSMKAPATSVESTRTDNNQNNNRICYTLRTEEQQKQPQQKQQVRAHNHLSRVHECSLNNNHNNTIQKDDNDPMMGLLRYEIQKELQLAHSAQKQILHYYDQLTSKKRRITSNRRSR